jgi:hypothetical protein
MQKARHLRRKHSTFVTHFNREDERPLIVHSGRHQSRDCLRHQRSSSSGWPAAYPARATFIGSLYAPLRGGVRPDRWRLSRWAASVRRWMHKRPCESAAEFFHRGRGSAASARRTLSFRRAPIRVCLRYPAVTPASYSCIPDDDWRRVLLHVAHPDSVCRINRQIERSPLAYTRVHHKSKSVDLARPVGRRFSRNWRFFIGSHLQRATDEQRWSECSRTLSMLLTAASFSH